jgi:hypothetical protein
LASLFILIALEQKIRSGLPPKKLIISLVILFILMAIESAMSFLHIFPAFNISRFATGYLVGWFISPVIAGLANSVAFDIKLLQKGKYLSNKKTLAIWITAIIPVAAIFYFTFEKAIIFWSIFSLAGLVLFIAFMAFIIIFASIKSLANSINGPKRYILFLLFSIIISLAFILASSALKTLLDPYVRLFDEKIFLEK